MAGATKHQFTHDVDPYVMAGDPTSGLLPLISPEPVGTDSAGDARVQAYCFRMCTTDVPENRIEWPKPETYDETRTIASSGKWWTTRWALVPTPWIRTTSVGS